MATTDLGTPYVPRSTVDGSNLFIAQNYFAQVALSNSTPDYSNLFWLVDENERFLEDITPYVVTNATTPTVKHDSTQDGVQTTLNFTYRRPSELQWGNARIKVFMLVRCDGVNGGQWFRFPRGVYVVTSPNRDLQDPLSREVSGYDKLYLLMSEQADSMSWGPGTYYQDAVADCFIAAGLIATRVDFSTIADSSGGWASKQIPSGQFRSYALSGSAQTYLSIVNALLADSGEQNLFVDFNGRYQVSDLPVPNSAALLWTWVADQAAQAFVTSGDYRAKIVLRANRAYNGDVYNQPNQFVFIDSNLTFTPTHTDGSDGMYVVNNTLTPPSDQTTVGRVIAHHEWLDASGTADLIAQGDAYVTKALGAIETITLQTDPWCVGWHYDVFLYADSALPGASTRRLQVQTWTLPLTGAPMEWETNVVSTT